MSIVVVFCFFLRYKQFSFKTQSCVTVSARRGCKAGGSDHSVWSLVPSHLFSVGELCLYIANVCARACVCGVRACALLPVH